LKEIDEQIKEWGSSFHDLLTIKFFTVCKYHKINLILRLKRSIFCPKDPMVKSFVKLEVNCKYRAVMSNKSSVG
jgi:hypothetical protein